MQYKNLVMKKIIFASIFAVTLLTSCGNNKTADGKSDSAAIVTVPTGGKSDSATARTPSNGNSGTQTATAKYQCPMQCEGTKTYDKPGKCPQCGMEMKEVK